MIKSDHFKLPDFCTTLAMFLCLLYVPRPCDGSHLQVAGLHVELQHLIIRVTSRYSCHLAHLHDIGMNFQNMQRDCVGSKSSQHFYPLHQPDTQVSIGKIQTFATNCEGFLSLS